MKKFSKFLKWIPPAFFALLILAGGASAIFFLLATILTLPIPKLQQFKKEKLKIGTGLTVLLSVILLVVGIMVSPTPPQDNDDECNYATLRDTTAEKKIDKGRPLGNKPIDLPLLFCRKKENTHPKMRELCSCFSQSYPLCNDG